MRCLLELFNVAKRQKKAVKNEFAAKDRRVSIQLAIPRAQKVPTHPTRSINDSCTHIEGSALLLFLTGTFLAPEMHFFIFFVLCFCLQFVRRCAVSWSACQGIVSLRAVFPTQSASASLLHPQWFELQSLAICFHRKSRQPRYSCANASVIHASYTCSRLLCKACKVERGNNSVPLERSCCIDLQLSTSIQKLLYHSRRLHSSQTAWSPLRPLESRSNTLPSAEAQQPIA